MCFQLIQLMLAHLMPLLFLILGNADVQVIMEQLGLHPAQIGVALAILGALVPPDVMVDQ